ncbi:ABC transporter permease [Nostoc sp. 'Peltigera membranacea cyanobiont' 232]|uniref:ABC transporter permease n=1 Tax=Nostoc sp. 'Peltigera membranacea cyanobiont' 232 TaxID=2014531 RepID=UPI00167291F4|nr:ABC transporter permease [Nostoc sp. 'Peltigera membranacea cyanobiont' 232]
MKFSLHLTHFTAEFRVRAGDAPPRCQNSLSNQPSNLKTVVYAEINSDVYDGLCLRIIWLTLPINGGLADLASVWEILGPISKLRLSISPSYSYTAIIATFIGQFSTLSIILFSLFMALLYVVM